MPDSLKYEMPESEYREGKLSKMFVLLALKRGEHENQVFRVPCFSGNRFTSIFMFPYPHVRPRLAVMYTRV